MLISETIIKSVIIIYALIALLAAFIVTYTAHTARKSIDETVLRARAFISKSFIRDNGELLFLACIFFFIHTVMEFNGTFIEESIADFIRELTELGISVCIVILSYKWFRLIKPSKQDIIPQKR